MAEESVAEIQARIGEADADELGRLATDERVTVRQLVEKERAARGITDESEVWRRAQEATGRPPAHEVAAARGEELYGELEADNADPEVMAAGPGAAAEQAATSLYDWALPQRPPVPPVPLAPGQVPTDLRGEDEPGGAERHPETGGGE